MAKAKSYEATGILHVKYDTESVTATFSKREFVLKIEDGNYPQYVKFQLVQDRCEHLDKYKAGEEIKVYFDIRGKETNGKYWSNLNAWKLETIGSAPPAKNKDEPVAENAGKDVPTGALPF